MMTKGQTWTVDFMIGTVMFFIALFVFYQYYSNTISIDLGEVKTLRMDAEGISNSLMSEGYPPNWNILTDDDDILQLGIVDDGFLLNDTRLARLKTLDYKDTRKLLNTKYDYYFYFLDKDKVIKEGYGGIASPSDIETQNPKKIVTLSRFVFYDRNIYRMVLYVWD